MTVDLPAFLKPQPRPADVAPPLRNVLYSATHARRLTWLERIFGAVRGA